MNPVKLTVRHLGHVPSFKNNKHLFITNKRNREWMDRCRSGFVYQLTSKSATAGNGTLTADALRFLIASLPPDDNWKVISEIHLTCECVPPGEEGADILIEPLPPLHP